MKTRIITLLIAISVIIVGSATAQTKVNVYKGGDIIYSLSVNEIDSIKFEKEEVSAPNIHNGYEYVDLGLPSGTQWATCNVGATTPEGYGNYYAWGETTAKSSYTSGNYTYSSNSTALPLSADAARVNWGGKWRMPTKAEQEELSNRGNCTWTWTTQNGVIGYKVTSNKNGNSIFLPAAGYCEGSDVSDAGSSGYYWTSSLSTGDSSNAYYFSFSSYNLAMFDYYRYYGHSVRAVFTDLLYSVSVSSSDEVMGSVTASATEVVEGETVTLTATPNEGYEFVNWTVGGEEVSTENPYSFFITQDIEVVANFQIIPGTQVFNITVSSANETMGSVEASKLEVVDGNTVTLTATANVGYRFVNWTVAGEEVSTENPYTATITAETTFVANFEALPIYAVSVSSNDDAMGTAEISATEAIEGETLTLTATPNNDYVFKHWTLNGNVVSTQNPYIAIVTSNSEYIAVFEIRTYNTYEYVDLGLSVKWATCNVGATTPEGYGDYFAWGETTAKSSYTSSNYTYSSNSTTLPLSADAARVNWGGSWRMPTKAEQEELSNRGNCTWTWTTQNGVRGYKVTSNKNGNSIFLPAAGYCEGSSVSDAGSSGYYWSSSLSTGDSSNAYYFSFSSYNLAMFDYYRYYGHSVRAVCP